MKNKEKILYILVFVIFLVLVCYVASKHEYWADEAQAWLLARDASIKDLLLHQLRYEGHPILWYLVIKLFMLFKLPYKYFNVISIIFSTLGVLVFLFKSKFKWYIKVLLPFTFFVFYQFSVIARSYCIVLFLLSLLASIWDKREEKYWLFTILLILLINLEVFTFLLAGSIFFLELVDFVKNKDKRNKVKITCFIVLFLSFLFTSIYLFPASSVYKPANAVEFRLSKTFFVSSNFSSGISIIIDFALMVFLALILCKKGKSYLYRTLILVMPIIAFIFIVYFNVWHYGVLFFIFLFIIWIYKLENDKGLIALLLITCFIQITWSVNSSLHDFNNVYFPSKNVANFIKMYDYKNLKIVGYGFNVVSINPYFEKNIYDNWILDKGFYTFNLKDESYFSYEHEREKYFDKADIIIFRKYKDYKVIFDETKYNLYKFRSFTTFQYNNFNEVVLFYVCVNKNIDNVKIINKSNAFFVD